jgi:hypothetical protein
MKKTYGFLAGFAFIMLLGGWAQWNRIDPEFRRALKMNLKSPEIAVAVKHYNDQGVRTEDITQKQLNDYIFILRGLQVDKQN